MIVQILSWNVRGTNDMGKRMMKPLDTYGIASKLMHRICIGQVLNKVYLLVFSVLALFLLYIHIFIYLLIDRYKMIYYIKE